MNRLAFVFRAFAWTAVLAAALFVTDRLLVGAPAVEGWTRAASVDALPASAGAVRVPAYLPHAVAWPPVRVFARGDGAPGWWLELAPREPGGPRMWLGSGEPAPVELGDAAGCVRREPPSQCPPQWHQLSRRIDGTTVHVLSTLPRRDLTRVLDHLRPR